MESLRRDAGYDVTRVGTEVGDLVAHDLRLEHVAAGAVGEEAAVVEVHH